MSNTYKAKSCGAVKDLRGEAQASAIPAKGIAAQSAADLVTKGRGISFAAALMAATGLLFGAGTASALQTPDLSKNDGRIKYVDYRPDDVVPINACEGVITTITFSEGERVENYGSGFSTAWEFATRGNHFYLKPKETQGTTNLIVMTDKRVYTFDVKYSNRRKGVTYRMIFRYPDEEKALAAEKAKAEEKKKLMSQDSIDAAVPSPKDELARLRAEERMSGSSGAGTSEDVDALVKTARIAGKPGYNWAYTMNFGKSPASKDLAPAAVYDDGRFTVIRLPAGAELPAVYQVRAEDGEQIVKTHVDPRTNSVIVEKVCRELRLRNGQAVVGLYNEDYGRLITGTPSKSTMKGLKRGWTEGAKE